MQVIYCQGVIILETLSSLKTHNIPTFHHTLHILKPDVSYKHLFSQKPTILLHPRWQIQMREPGSIAHSFTRTSNSVFTTSSLKRGMPSLHLTHRPPNTTMPPSVGRLTLPGTTIAIDMQMTSMTVHPHVLSSARTCSSRSANASILTARRVQIGFVLSPTPARGSTCWVS